MMLVVHSIDRIRRRTKMKVNWFNAINQLIFKWSDMS